MFSVNNINEEEKKNKKQDNGLQFHADESMFAPLGNGSQQQYQALDSLPKQGKFYSEPYQNNSAMGSNSSATYTMNASRENVIVPDTVKSPKVLDFGAEDKKNGVHYAMPSKEVLQVGYNKPGSWGDFVRRETPDSTPYRSTAIYSISQKALDDVADEYYTSELKDIYKNVMDEDHDEMLRIFDKYERNPNEAMQQTKELRDPMKAIDKAMERVDTVKLRQMVEPLARYGGFDTDFYIDSVLKPTLRDRIIREYVDRNKPKSSSDYILRSAFSGSMLGKLGYMTGAKPYAALEQESLASYGGSRLENFAAGVGSLMIDAPVFKGLGLLSNMVVGKATSFATDRLASRIYSYGSAEGISKAYASRIAERAIMNKLSTKIAQNAAIQGLTLGTYDVANSVADDVLYNEGIDGRKAAGSFAKGFLTGAATGVVGTPLRYSMRGLTGGKKMLGAAGVLSAESAVFTLSTEADKLLHGVEIEPIDIFYDYAESTATLGIMKMMHWRPTGAKNKLKADGSLKDELKLSNSEQEELREMNIDPADFMLKVEKSLNLPSYANEATSAEIKEKYLKMMQSKELSATTRSKLMYIIENKLTSTPPVPFGYDVKKNRKGKWLFTTYDFDGNKIEQHVFEHSGLVQNHLLVEKSKLRKNRIAVYESELLNGFGSQNLLRQAGIYAKEKNINVDDISHALYKRAKNEPLSSWENFVVREIVDRTSYDESGMVQYLSDVRRGLEKKYSLEEGSLLTKIDEPFYKCSAAENGALEEYESIVRDEVNSLKNGADASRAADFKELGRNSIYNGMTNEEVKSREIEDFYSKHTSKNDAAGTGVDVKPIDIDDSAPSGYLWSYNGVKNTPEDIAAFESMAQNIADRFNLTLRFVRNEREIPLPDSGDKFDVANYNNKLRSMGWVEKNGGVTINLPNIGSAAELEKTVVHEGVAHGGLGKLFGNHLNYFLEEVYRKASDNVRAEIDKVQSQYSFADNYTIIEEYLAKLAEKTVLTTSERAIVNSFKDFIKNSLVRLNIYTGRNRRITESDLQSLIRQHAKYMRKRTAPSDYRRWVFGLFDSAKQDEKSYYDREAYENVVKEKMSEGKFMKNTPSSLYNTKAFLNYELMPEDMQARFRERWNVNDEMIRNAKVGDRYRFIGKKGADNRAYYEGHENGDPELALAIEMENNDMPSDNIKLTTGWERGADYQWRKERPDGKMKVRDHLYMALLQNDKKLAKDYLSLKETPMDNWGKDETAVWERVKRTGNEYFKDARLSDILHDPSFYVEYPELATLPVELVDNPKIPFRYDSKNKKLLLDKSFFLYPQNSVYMSGVLQNVIQDYEGFSKAVSMNVIGINTRLERKYKQACDIISLLDRAKEVASDFDQEGVMDAAFAREYQFTPAEFKKRFPSFDEYVIYKLTGMNFSFSGDVEMRNVMNRFNTEEFTRRATPATATEDVPRSRQALFGELSHLKDFFYGPLDVIYQKLSEMHSDEPLVLEKLNKRVRRADLTPFERSRFEWEMEEYATELLKKYMNGDKAKFDYGYDEWKKGQDREQKKWKDYLEFKDWENRFKNFKQDPEDLN